MVEITRVEITRVEMLHDRMVIDYINMDAYTLEFKRTAALMSNCGWNLILWNLRFDNIDWD
jgi:hypothetical protein